MPEPDVPQYAEIRQEAAQTLTTEQIQAIQLLIAGKSNTDAAEALNKDRHTITRWRQNPHFIAELNRQRKDVYEAGQTRLHGLLHKAISVIEQKLDEDKNLKAAMEVLRLLNVTPKTLKPDHETDPEAIVAREAERLAIGAFNATPFAQDQMGLAAGRNRELQSLTDDIYALIKEKYSVPTALQELVE